MLEFLQGKKTYIIAAISGLVFFAQTLGWITPEQVEQIYLLLAPLGLATLRAGVDKAPPSTRHLPNIFGEG